MASLYLCSRMCCLIAGFGLAALCNNVNSAQKLALLCQQLVHAVFGDLRGTTFAGPRLKVACTHCKCYFKGLCSYQLGFNNSNHCLCSSHLTSCSDEVLIQGCLPMKTVYFIPSCLQTGFTIWILTCLTCQGMLTSVHQH